MSAPAIADLQVLVDNVQTALLVAGSTTTGTDANVALASAVATAKTNIQSGLDAVNADMVGLIAASASTGQFNPNTRPSKAVLFMNAIANVTGYLATLSQVSGYVGRLAANLDNI